MSYDSKARDLKNKTSNENDLIEHNAKELSIPRHDRISFERGSRDDILRLLEKCCSGNGTPFTGVVRINIASPSKTTFKLYIIDNAIRGVESSEEIFVYKGADALKRLIDLLTIPSTTGTMEFIRQREEEVKLRLEVNPEIVLSKPTKYEDILLFIPMKHSVPVIEKEAIELIGDEIDIALPSAIEAKVEETESVVEDKLADVGKRMSALHTVLLEESERVLVFNAPGLEKILETLRIMSQSDYADEALLARVLGSGELGELKCQLLFVNGTLLGIWCESMGLEVYGNEALRSVESSEPPLRVEVYRLDLSKIAKLLKLSLSISENGQSSSSRE